jgi:hypothetical protein
LAVDFVLIQNTIHHFKEFIDLIGSKFTSPLLLVVLLVELGCGVKITMGDGGSLIGWEWQIRLKPL